MPSHSGTETETELKTIPSTIKMHMAHWSPIFIRMFLFYHKMFLISWQINKQTFHFPALLLPPLHYTSGHCIEKNSLVFLPHLRSAPIMRSGFSLRLQMGHRHRCHYNKKQICNFCKDRLITNFILSIALAWLIEMIWRNKQTYK